MGPMGRTNTPNVRVETTHRGRSWLRRHQLNVRPRDSIHITSKATRNGAEVDAEIDVLYALRARPEWEEKLRRLSDRIARAWRGAI